MIHVQKMTHCPICSNTFKVTGTHEVYKVCTCQETVQDKEGNWIKVGFIQPNYVGGLEAPLVAFAKTCGSGTFIDVGANRGQWTLPFLNQFTRILCFEPDPVNYETLRAVMRPYKHVLVFDTAISNRTGPATLYVRRDSTQLNSLTNIYKATESVPVLTQELRYIINGPVDLVKVDVEGHELEVIEGSGDKISLVKNWVVERHSGVTEIKDLLQSKGYNVMVFSSLGWTATKL